MAVAFTNSTGIATGDTGVTQVDSQLFSTFSGTDIGILVQLQLNPLGSAPTGVAMVLDPTGLNASLTLIDSYNPGTGAYFYLFAILGVSVSARIVRATWTNSCYGIGQVCVLTGVKQTSVAAAFTNAAHNTNSFGSASVTVTSATNNLAIAHFQCTISSCTPNQTSIWGPSPWANLSLNSGGNYDVGAASVPLTASVSGTWVGQGINVNVSITAWDGSAALAGTGGATLTANLREQTKGALTGSGAIVANVFRDKTLFSANFAGAGVARWSSVDQIDQWLAAVAAFSGASALSANAIFPGIRATLAAVAALSVDMPLWRGASAAFWGNDSTLVGRALSISATTAILIGSGGFTGPARQVQTMPNAASLAGSGALVAVVTGRQNVPATAALAGAAQFVVPPMLQALTIRRGLVGIGSLVPPIIGQPLAVSSLTFRGAGSLSVLPRLQRPISTAFSSNAVVAAVDVMLLAGGQPPQALALLDRTWDDEVNGPNQEALFSNYNDQLVFECDPGLVGNDQGVRGAAQTIRLMPPLMFGNSQNIEINLSGITVRLDVLEAINSAVRLSVLEAQNSLLQNQATMLQAQVSVLQAQVSLLQSQVNTLMLLDPRALVALFAGSGTFAADVTSVAVHANLAGSGAIIINVTGGH